MVKKSQNKLEKAEKNLTKHTKDDEKKPVVISIILLVLMVSSLVAFAFVDTGTTPGGNSESGYQNLPFGEYQTQQGMVWGAIINSEQFLFPNLEFLNNREDFAQKAQTIKNSESLNIYLEPQYNNSDGAFLLEQKIPSAFSIEATRITNLTQCTQNTIVFTYNTTQNNYEGCTVIKSIPGEEALDAQALAYFMVNDFQG